MNSINLSLLALMLMIVIGFVSIGNTAEKEPTEGKNANPKSLLAYIGTYTNGASEGIYLFRFDLASGKLTPLGLVGKAENPSFVAIHPNRKYLYSVIEVGTSNGKPTGLLVSFAIDAKTGKLTRLNQQETQGGAPCHLIVDKAGKNVLAANYTGGSVVCFPIGKDGQLKKASSMIQHTGNSINPRRQKGPHAHSINLDLSGKYAFVADLGLDKVLVYKFDSALGKLTPNKPASIKLAPGSGPRHYAIHPTGKFTYVINEMNCTVTAFRFNQKDGALKELQTISTLPKSGIKKGYSTAEVQVHKSGKFLYGSNRGHNSIVVYQIDPKNGTLKYIENVSTGGKTPRNFSLDPSGKYLIAANKNSDKLVVYKIDSKTGKLTPTGHTASCPSPVCVKFLAPAK